MPAPTHPRGDGRSAVDVPSVFYTRVSTSDQAEHGLSLPIQRETISRYCQQNGLTLLKGFEDAGRSGATIERPGLQALLAEAKERRFKKVVVTRLDRLSRSLYEGLWLQKQLLIHGVEVVSISEPNGGDALTSAMRAIIQTFAELERAMITERLWSGRRKRLAQGQFAGGSIPFGMKLDRRTAKLIPDPKTADVIRVLFKLRAKGLTYKQLAAEMNRLGHKAPSGGAWRPSTAHYACNNKTYLGALKYGESKSNAHEPLIREGR